MRYIEDFQDEETIMGHYLCKQKQTLKSKSGKSYFSLVLSDRTGQIGAKIWDLNNNIQNFDENDFIKIDANVQMYNGELQIKINKARKSTEGEYIPADYIPTTDKDINALYNQILEFIASIQNTHIKELVENILVNDKKAEEAFKISSAAKSLHHGYMGGLVEHTLSVVTICDFMSIRYKHVNRDILIATAILHDFGKIYELSPFPLNDYTDEGQLLGHHALCIERIGQEADKISGFPEKLKRLLQHCIIAHHGEYEYGSAKLPQTIEAFILYSCDNLDAKVKSFEEFISADKTKASWIGWHKSFARPIRKSDF